MFVGRLLVGIGSLILFYAAYSYRDYKKHAFAHGGGSTSELPSIEVIIQVSIGFILALVGLIINLHLKPIQVASSIRSTTFEETFGDNDYMTFNHRGLEINKRMASLK